MIFSVFKGFFNAKLSEIQKFRKFFKWLFSTYLVSIFWLFLGKFFFLSLGAYNSVCDQVENKFNNEIVKKTKFKRCTFRH